MMSFVGHKWADSTLEGYGREWELVVRYCGERGFCTLPAEPRVVALFITFRFMEGVESAGGMACAAITAMHEAKGLPTPSTAQPW